MGGLQSFTLRSGDPEQSVDLGAAGGVVTVAGATVYYRDEPRVTVATADGSLAAGSSITLYGTQWFATLASRADVLVSVTPLANVPGDLLHTGAKVGLFGATPTVRVPFSANPSVNGPDAVANGASDVGVMVLAPKLKGAFTGITGSNAGWGWCGEGFAQLDTDLRGITTVWGWLWELAVLQDGGTIDIAIGQQADLAFFGAGSRATITNGQTMRVSAPRRKDGATQGTFGTAYCLFIEDIDQVNVVSPGTITGGKFSLYVEGGVSRFGGRVDVFDTITNNGSGGLSLYAGFSDADGGRLQLEKAASGGHVRARMAVANAEFQVHDGTTTNWSVSRTGLPKWNLAGNQQTTVGAAGGASALPATPTKYLKVVDSTGATLVIPAYAP